MSSERVLKWQFSYPKANKHMALMAAGIARPSSFARSAIRIGRVKTGALKVGRIYQYARMVIQPDGY